MKPNGRVDLQLRRADAILSLAKLSADKADSDALAENETLKQERAALYEQLAVKDARIAELEASQHPIQTVTVPDPDAAVIRAASLAKDDLIQNTAQAIRENAEEPTRLRVAAALVTRLGRKAQPIVAGIADWASIVTFNQKSDEDLQEIISSAFVGSRGSAVQLARATLAVRNVSVIGPNGTKPKYKDVFDEIDGKYQEEL